MHKAGSVKAAVKKDTTVGQPVAWENPLIPNKKLRALYVAMLELRLLEEHTATLPRKAGRAQTRYGEEGCRVSTTSDLKPGDLTSNLGGLSTSYLRGAKLAEVVRGASTAKTSGTVASETPGQLPVVENAVERLHLAMGAAWALKDARKGFLLIAYMRSNEATAAEWKPLLRFAAEQKLPVIFVVLPGSGDAGPRAKPGAVSLLSSKCGVPGIPVDAADPVALYRVAQESMLRARARGGPVLMECIAFHPATRKTTAADPIQTMREFLLGRKIVDEAWIEGVESRFRQRLARAVHGSG